LTAAWSRLTTPWLPIPKPPAGTMPDIRRTSDNRFLNARIAVRR
jgi:hypothetical protein